LQSVIFTEASNAITVGKLREIVTKANEQEPDMIVLLGDYVRILKLAGSFAMPMNEVADGIAGLHAKYGVFAVLGNHDGWYGDDGRDTTAYARWLSCA
jgi:predicted MPP superfamily phosphohydrolase